MDIKGLVHASRLRVNEEIYSICKCYCISSRHCSPFIWQLSNIKHYEFNFKYVLYGNEHIQPVELSRFTIICISNATELRLEAS